VKNFQSVLHYFFNITHILQKFSGSLGRKRVKISKTFL